MPRSISTVPGHPRIQRFSFLLSSNRRPLELLLLLPLLAWLAFNWFHTIEEILRYYTPLPIWDYWRVVQNFESYKALDLRVFWKQHNEHRILFPELVFAADMLLMHGRLILPLIVSFVCYVGTWVVMAVTLLADRALSPVIRYVIVLLSGIVIGWQGSAQVVAIPFLLNWTLLQFTVCLALYWITRLKQSSRPIYLAGAILCAVVANYSCANGLFFWPILLLSGLILSLKRRHLWILAAAAIASMGLFFVGYHVMNSLNLRNIVMHPGYFFEFVSAYVGSPFLDIPTPRANLWVGFVSLGAFFVLVALAARNRLLASKPAIVFFGYYAFTLLTAAVTAAGRMNPADVDFRAATAFRYVTLPLVNWAVLIAAAIWLPYRLGKRAISSGIALAAAVLLWTAFPALTSWVDENDARLSQQLCAVISIENGIFDPALVLWVNPFPPWAKADLQVLRKYRLSIYSKEESNWLGQPARNRFAVSAGPPQTGQITQVLPIESGLEVTGWAERVRAASYSPRIVFLNPSGRIVGFGRKPPMGLPSYLASGKTPASIAWVGFINLKLSPEGGPFSAYVINRRGKSLAPISGAISTPAVRPVSATDIGPLIPDLGWQMDRTWTAGSLPPGVNPAMDSLPSKQFFSSWSGSDQNTGRIVSSPIAVSSTGNCIALPSLKGPSSGGLSIKLIDAKTGAVLAAVPIEGNDSEWRIWRIPFQGASGYFRILAEDEGSGWGQWLAIGQPSRCR